MSRVFDLAYDPDRYALVLGLLATAVLAEISNASRVDEELRMSQMDAAAQAMKSGMDDTLYGGRDCAGGFAAVARSLALLSFAYGGVAFGPLRFCAAHMQERWREADGVICPHCLREEIERKPSATEESNAA